PTPAPASATPSAAASTTSRIPPVRSSRSLAGANGSAQTQPRQKPVKVDPVDAGGARHRRDVALLTRQLLLEIPPFHIAHPALANLAQRLLRVHRRRQLGPAANLHPIQRLVENERAVHVVFQLAYVARPAMARQRRQRGWREQGAGGRALAMT